MNPPRTQRLRWLAMLFACLFPTLAAWTYFVALRGADNVRAAYVLGKVVQFGFPIAWVVAVERCWPRPGRPTRAGLATGAAFGGGVGLAMLGLYFFRFRHGPELAETPARLFAKLASAGIESAGAFLVLGAFVAIVHSLLEEYYWRWFVFGRMRALVPTWLAVGISSIAFALHHVILIAAYLRPEQFWTGALFLSFCVAAGGAVWAVIYHRSGSLYGGWLSHALVDVALIIIGYDLCRGYLAS